MGYASTSPSAVQWVLARGTAPQSRRQFECQVFEGHTWDSFHIADVHTSSLGITMTWRLSYLQLRRPKYHAPESTSGYKDHASLPDKSHESLARPLSSLT